MCPSTIKKLSISKFIPINSSFMKNKSHIITFLSLFYHCFNKEKSYFHFFNNKIMSIAGRAGNITATHSINASAQNTLMRIANSAVSAQKIPSAGTRTLLIVGTERVCNFGKISCAPERIVGQIPDAMRDKPTEIASADYELTVRVI